MPKTCAWILSRTLQIFFSSLKENILKKAIVKSNDTFFLKEYTNILYFNDILNLYDCLFPIYRFFFV